MKVHLVGLKLKVLCANKVSHSFLLPLSFVSPSQQQILQPIYGTHKPAHFTSFFLLCTRNSFFFILLSHQYLLSMFLLVHLCLTFLNYPSPAINFLAFLSQFYTEKLSCTVGSALFNVTWPNGACALLL
jgi:hypothetical protein